MGPFWRLPPALQAPAARPPERPETAPESNRRGELNLLGQADAQSGESRRNENIQFNLVDNNLLKELNVRLDAGRQQIRGQVNGNVLVPRPDERTALAADPEVRRAVQRFLDAYPKALPNRTDVNPRALNTN
jgi:hypothetical protein